MKKFKETWYSRCVYQNELDKGCFQRDMAYGDFKGLKRRTTADNVLRVNHLILLNYRKNYTNQLLEDLRKEK